MGGFINTWADCRGAFYRTTIPGPAGYWVQGGTRWTTYQYGFGSVALGSGLIRTGPDALLTVELPGLQDPVGMQVLRAKFVDEKVADELIGGLVKFDNGQTIEITSQAFTNFGGSGQIIPEPEGETPYALFIDEIEKLAAFTS